MERSTARPRPTATALSGPRAATGGAAARGRPARAPHPTASPGGPTCRGCGQPGRTRDEAADLAVGWLLYDAATGTAVPARFHQGCRPPGVPGELECAACGEGPLLGPELDRPSDLLTAAALAAWLDEHRWSGDPDTADALHCPDCLPHRRVGRAVALSNETMSTTGTVRASDLDQILAAAAGRAG